MIGNKSIRFLKKLALSLIALLGFAACENFDDPGAYFDSYGSVAKITGAVYNRKLTQKGSDYYVDASDDFIATYLIDNPGDFTFMNMFSSSNSYKVEVTKSYIRYTYPKNYLASIDGNGSGLSTLVSLIAIAPNGKMIIQDYYQGPKILCNSPPPKIENAVAQMYSDTSASINERLVIPLQIPVPSTQYLRYDYDTLVVTDTRSGTVHEFPFLSYSSYIPTGTESNGWSIGAYPMNLGPTCPGGPTFTYDSSTGGSVCYIYTDVYDLTSIEPFPIKFFIRDKLGLEGEELEIPSRALKLAAPTCSDSTGVLTNSLSAPYAEFIIYAPSNASDATLHYTITDSSGNPVADTSGSATEHVGDATFRLYPKVDGSAETYTISQAYASKTGYVDSDDAAATFGSAGTVSVTGVQLEPPVADPDPASVTSLPQDTEVTFTSPQNGNLLWLGPGGVSPVLSPSPLKVTLESPGSNDFAISVEKDYYQYSATANFSYNVTLAKVYVKSGFPDSNPGTKNEPVGTITKAMYILQTNGDPTSSANMIYILGDMTSIDGLTSVSSGYYNIVGCDTNGNPGVPVTLTTSAHYGLLQVGGGTLTLRAVTLAGMDMASNGAIHYLGGTLILKDKVTITGNSSAGAAKNINIATSGLKISVDAGGLAGTKVGVTSVDVPAGGTSVTITDGYKDACGTEPLGGHFVSDVPGYAFIFDAAGEAALATGGGSIDVGDIYSVSFAKTASAGVYTFTASATLTSGGSPVDITSQVTAWSLKLYYLNTDTGMTSATNTMDLSSLGEGTYIMKIKAVYGGKTYSGEVEIKISEPMPAGLVLIPHGNFKRAESSSNPAYTVTLTKDFYICDHEVTQKEWFDVMGVKQEDMYATDKGWGDNYPVYYVNWYAAIAYCNKRSVKEGLTPCYSVSGVTDWAALDFASIPTSSDSTWNAATCSWTATGYRLPTEAEWEYAALGSYKDNSHWTGYIDSNHPSANVFAGYDETNALGDYAWYSGNASSKTHEAKKKTENSYSLYDMSGNVSEWCWDWYGNYDSANVTDPTGAPSGFGRVYRGGNWSSSAGICSVADRGNYNPYSRYDYIGFRVVRNAP